MSKLLQNIIISVSSIIIASFFSYIGLYHWSQSKVIQKPLDSELTRLKGPIVVAWMGASEDYPPGSLPAIENAVKSGAWIWLDIRPTLDHQWVILTDVFLQKATTGKGLIGQRSWAELIPLKILRNGTPSDEGLQRLEDIVTKFPVSKFILNFKEYRPGDDVVIRKFIRANKLNDRVILQSEIQGLLTDIRKEMHDQAFGQGFAQLAKLKLLLRSGLAGLIDLNGDFVFFHEHGGKIFDLKLDKELVDEVHRRGRKIFWGNRNESELNRLVNFGVDGLISKNPLNDCKALRNHGFQSCAGTPQ